LDALSHAQLATLVREYLLCGHLIDRSGMPHVLSELGLDGMGRVAIEEWMGASPIYTRRMQKLLNFEGSNVETIFKGMQFDIGAPPQFMDFRYQVTDDEHGEFWLDCCGALMDVEPMGDVFVVNMCHDIEDPTFDATAAATNPRARMRPIHRPPRVPSDRAPHCHWTVEIDADADPLPMPAEAERLSATRLAQLPLPAHDATTDYSGPLQADVDLEAFSDSTLRAICDEVALQGHLLTLSYADAVQRRCGREKTADLVTKQFTGIAGLAAERLVRALQITDLGTLIALHPAFRPASYIAVTAAADERITLHDCPAIGDRPGMSWADVLAGGACEPLDAIVHALDPSAAVVADGERSWRVERMPDPRRRRREVALAGHSTGADFRFIDRGARGSRSAG
jgi:hypothetical protein